MAGVLGNCVEIVICPTPSTIVLWMLDGWIGRGGNMGQFLRVGVVCCVVLVVFTLDVATK